MAGGNLPAETGTLIGRADELVAVKTSLALTRLLTLTGAGGCGKTSLALLAARELDDSFRDGVWIVNLASAADDGMVARSIALALGIDGGDGRPLLAAITDAIAPRQLLLVLDNCEHVLDSVAPTALALILACPRLRILATSREPLRIAGEVARRVPSLALPALDSATSDHDLAACDSVTLFVVRARSRSRDFSLGADNSKAVATICRRLGGLPLAIELAAGLTNALSPGEIAERLDDALGILQGGARTLARHATLRATLDWSYSLLGEAERLMLGRLAVFTGEFDLKSAEVVSGDTSTRGGDVARLAAALVEKSLVESRIVDGASRFRLLEPVRQYAIETLSQAAGTESRRRHARYFSALVEAYEPALMSGARSPVLVTLERDYDNLRAALEWCAVAPDPEDVNIGLRLATSLCWYWMIRGDISEGLDWLERLLKADDRQAGHPEQATSVRAKALYAASELTWHGGRTELARERAESSVKMWREIGDKRWLAYALQSLPMAVGHPNAAANLSESLMLFEEVEDPWGLALAATTVDLISLDGSDAAVVESLEANLVKWRILRDEWGAAQVLNVLGDCARSAGQDKRAAACYEESLRLLRGQGITGTVPSVVHNLGWLALRRGETRRAFNLFRESLALFNRRGDRRGMAESLAGIAAATSAMGHGEQAARLFGQSEALMELVGATIWPATLSDYQRAIGDLRQRVGDETLARAWADGRTTRSRDVIQEILASESVLASGPTGKTDLTAREREVAVLVAKGLTNRQIGGALFITEGTARLHVKHILAKLAFASRSQVAAWAVKEGLATRS